MSLLAFPVWLRGHGFNPQVSTESTEAVDAFILLNLACFLVVFSGFVVAGWAVWRRHVRPEPHEKLLQELHDELDGDTGAMREDAHPKLTSGDRGEGSAPWEKPADWWKRQED